MTKQSRRTWAMPPGTLRGCKIGSRFWVHKVNEVEIFLPVLVDQTFVANRNGEPITGHLDYVIDRLEGKVEFNRIFYFS